MCSWKLILPAFVLALAGHACSQQVHRRFEYKYSFKPPYLAQKDGSVPFWEYGGNAIASSENVRLAPSLRSQKGAIWSKQPINFEWWDVDIMFKITGRGRIGADGLAFWYTTSKGEYTGEVFGSSDRWTGLAVIFDSFDNDNKHNNPYIMGVINDGTKSFDHKSDGATQLVSGCLRDFRNKPFPTRARIEYYMNTLTVHFHSGMTNNEADYELCFRAENVVLPKGGHFGLSAATGGLADDHDVIHFLATSLHPPGSQAAGTQAGQQAINENEQRKLSDEYTEYQKKLEQQKADYRKEHPDEVRDKDGEFEDWFESDNQRELRQIFQGQSQIYEIMKELNKKVDEVIGKQINSLSMLTAIHSGQQGVPQVVQPGQAPPQIAAGGLPIARHDWDTLIANHNILVQHVADMKTSMAEVSRKSDSILLSRGVTIGQLSDELKENMNFIKNNLATLMIPKPALNHEHCPVLTCVSPTVLVAAVVAQLAIMFVYGIYKEKKEAQAKKFF